MKLIKQKIYSEIKAYLIITLGLFLNAFAWTAFLIPSKVVGGGISGIGTLIYYATGFPVGITFLIVNVFLIIIGLKVLGKGFGVKTVYGVIGLSVFLSLLQSIIKEPIVNDRFMAAIIGGMIGGASIGMIFTQGGSTGGTDIIAMIINKYRNVSPGRILLYIDLVIISSSYILFQSLEIMVYGYVSMGVASYAVDLLLIGSRQSVQVFIFSKKNSEVADMIGNELKRGVTILNGKGWFTKEEQEIVLVILRKYELQQVMRHIKEIDRDAFISIGNVTGVYGKGFEPIKY
jgi:uncharacterized membrane-anchored protein YitT (DUF2179 family)